LIEGQQIPNNPGRVGSDGKLYTSAGIPRDQGERLPKGKAVEDEDEDSAERGKRGMSAAAPVEEGIPRSKTKVDVHWEGGADPKARASEPPIDVSTPSIDELLELMSRQIMQVVTWTHAEGFLDSYRSAGPNARGLFHAAVIKLAARADQLRRS
jgi:hypothetical protein